MSLNKVQLIGNLGKGGLDFGMALKAYAKGGCVEVIGEHLYVEDADEVLLYFTAGTTYRMQDIQKETEAIIEKAEKRDFADLLSEHEADYRSRRIDYSDFKVERNFKQIPAARHCHDEIHRWIPAGRHTCIYLRSRTDSANGPAFSLERTRPRSHRATRQNSLFSYSDRTPEACFRSHPF